MTWYNMSYIVRLRQFWDTLYLGLDLHKNAASNIEQVLEAAHNKAAAVRSSTAHHVNYPS